MSCSSDTANAFLTRAGSVPCWSSLSRCAGRSTTFSTERKMKVLVVEDEVCQQEWLTRNLSNTGHETHFTIHCKFTSATTTSRTNHRHCPPACSILPESKVGSCRCEIHGTFSSCHFS